MMGRQEAGQAPLFYAFNLEDHFPASTLRSAYEYWVTAGLFDTNLS